jgi:hypothetical protein
VSMMSKATTVIIDASERGWAVRGVRPGGALA